MAPRKKTGRAVKTARPAKAAAKPRGGVAKGKAVAEVAEPIVNERAVTPLECLEGEPSTNIKGDLQRLLDEMCKNKTAKDLETDEAVVQGLRKILLSWRDVQSEDKPQKLVYLLNTAHDRKQLRLAALDKEDAKKAALLDVHARKYGFHVGLGEIVFLEEGYGLRMGGPRGRNRGGRFGGRFGGFYRGCHGYGDMDSDSEMDSESEGGWDDPYSHAGGDDVEMEEVHETKLTLENLVDLEGTVLAEAVELTAGAEVLHEDVEKKLKMRGHTKQKFSATKCSTLERWYRGRALLVWPKSRHFDILHGPNALTHACYTLKKSTSAQRTREARDLVDMILSRTDVARSWAASTYICEAAVLWGDADLWVRAVRACETDRAISELRPDNIFAAIGAFGFDAIKECVERALEQDKTPLMTLLFLENLEAKASQAGDDGAPYAFAEEWAPEWRLKIVSTIKNPNDYEAGTILDASIKAGGAKILEKTVIPTLKATASPAFMLALAGQIHATKDITPGVKKRIVKDVLVFALSQAKIYDTMDDAATLTFAEAALKACLQTGNEPSAAELANRLVDLSSLDEAAVRKRCTAVFLPLAGAVPKLVGDHPSAKALAAVNTICDTAIAQFWTGLSAQDATVNSKDVKAFLDTARMSSMAVPDIIGKLLALDLKSSVLETFINELNSRRSAGTLDGIDDALPALVQKFAQIVSIDTSSFMYYKYRFQPPVVQSVACCIRAGVPDAARTIIDRVLKQYPAKSDDVSLVVVLVASRLPGWLAEIKRTPTDPAYAALFRRLYTFWVDTMMGPLRATPGLAASVAALEKRIAEWEKECACGSCDRIRGIVQGWRAEYEFEDISAKVRSHMKRSMNTYLDKQIHAKNSSYGHGFKVTKYAELLTASRWRTWKAEGNSFLNDLAGTTSEEDIKIVLGNDYARIVQTLRGTAAPANALKRPADGAPVASGSGLTAPSAAKRRKV